jgi:hypothetical protein
VDNAATPGAMAGSITRTDEISPAHHVMEPLHSRLGLNNGCGAARY